MSAGQAPRACVSRVDPVLKVPLTLQIWLNPPAKITDDLIFPSKYAAYLRRSTLTKEKIPKHWRVLEDSPQPI